MSELTAKRLRELLDYDPQTGVFRWKVKHPKSWVKVGSVAGGANNFGHLRIKIAGRKYAAHRLAWLYIHGRWPADQIDHINRIKNDNRLVNLREATPSENQRNRSAQKNNSTGYKGVLFHKGKYQARIRLHRKTICLGCFTTPEEAAVAYRAAANRFHGEFAFTPERRELNHTDGGKR